ncbi:dihydrolipoyl dehydrogenase family protein [Terracoccus luteus]|uniref:Pyruvate/2-oxoglutarate dehydrogenase complex dihydrolipoamide dehydrogenase (E3) component n=1 Tax=Terracoccus luteus TaxID=53356 RepID=A0A839PX34_9MICO|nr:FAD-dependent oxidoreductase [Terracoccus luteus]MBB2988087.1 pyruvate/2-oxoglutarate dehydrogenase complex dihydrolipoamide dehydrogenase (E3) component [Terracoccus luteus]MCP2173738.1 pyruvate/2-oxoglutarate dehydrogenase complex dihydrolipoamide dehydrogenase (E3) component [Terracoccus luteus]
MSTVETQAFTATAPPPDTRGGPWDLLVVGGGTAGIVGAKTAARLGARVLLVERDHPGGDCLFTGCVPSKSLLAAAHAAATARGAARFGVNVPVVDVDFPAVMAHVNRAIDHIAPTDSAAALEAAGVRVTRGTAVFVGPDAVQVDGARVPFRQALLATGAGPTMPPIDGLLEADPLTSDTMWGLRDLPRRLAVLGGGSIGCEVSQAFARLGSDVSLVEAGGALLPREDPAASALVAAAVRADGVGVRTGAAVVAVSGRSGSGGALHLADGGVVDFDVLVVAAGRSPRTAGLGLDSAGVTVDETGHVVVDRRLRTSNTRIWAAGDLTGHPQFTHLAGVHAATAATNAVLGLRRSISLDAVPRVTFTHPEVAAVGVPTGDTAEGHQVRTWDHDAVDRAVADGETTGFTRLVTDRRGRVVGATVVGPRAGEALAELTLAVNRGLTTGAIAGTTHPYPTYGDGPWNAAIADVQERLARPVTARVIATLASTRRWLLDRRS